MMLHSLNASKFKVVAARSMVEHTIDDDSAATGDGRSSSYLPASVGGLGELQYVAYQLALGYEPKTFASDAPHRLKNRT